MFTGIAQTDLTEPADNQGWLVNRLSDGISTVHLAFDTFSGGGDDAKLDQYFAGLTDESTSGWIRSGIPLARITSGGNTGYYGPYDPDAEDGRATAIEGFLESQIRVDFTRSGLKYSKGRYGMRYTGVLDKTQLPYSIDGATVHGWFLAWDKTTGEVAPLTSGGSTGGAAPAETTWANISGKPAPAAAIADLTDAPTAADVNKILAALRSFGVVAAK